MKKLRFTLLNFFSLKTILVLALLNLSLASVAQKLGYINGDEILKKMPEYKAAQQEIDGVSVNYQKEIEKMQQELDGMYQDYKKEEILLTEEMKQKKKELIVEKETAIRDYRQKIFGHEGIIFQKRQELLTSVYEKLLSKVREVAQRHKLQFVFDKSYDLLMIYTDPMHDYTDFVLEALDLNEKEKK